MLSFSPLIPLICPCTVPKNVPRHHVAHAWGCRGDSHGQLHPAELRLHTGGSAPCPPAWLLRVFPLSKEPPCTMGTLCALSAAVQAQPVMLGSLGRTLGWGGSISTQQLQKFPTPGEAQLRHGGVPSPTEPRCTPSARTASARGLPRAAAQINGELSAHHCIHLEGRKPRRRLFGNTAKLVRSASDLPIERLLGLGTTARSCRDKAAWRYQMLRP